MLKFLFRLLVLGMIAGAIAIAVIDLPPTSRTIEQPVSLEEIAGE